MDFICAVCFKEQKDPPCKYCHYSPVASVYVSYYAAYFSQYYGDYYGDYYWNYFAGIFHPNYLDEDSTTMLDTQQLKQPRASDDATQSSAPEQAL